MLISLSDRYHPRASLRQNGSGYALTGICPEWKVLLRDLVRLTETAIRHNGADWRVRSAARAGFALDVAA